MELQFQKTECTCLQQVNHAVQEQEMTQEVRISDGMPDIGRVLGAWGQCILRGKEWRSGEMAVSGGVTVWVLYLPEEGGLPQCVETWLPFQMQWDIPEGNRDGIILTQCQIRSVDARHVSARRLMVRGVISVMAASLLDDHIPVYTPGELPDDVQLLTETYPMELPREAGEKAFSLEEQIPVPGNCPIPEQRMYYTLQPVVLEKKVMGSKLIFRGEARVHTLYLGQDGMLHCWDFSVPFSQYTQLERDYGEMASAWVLPAVTALELDLHTDGTLDMKAGICCQYVICDRELLTVSADAYSPVRQIEVQQQMLRLPVILQSQQQALQAEATAQVSGMQAVDTVFYPTHPQLRRVDGELEVTLRGQFQMLCYDENGELQSAAPQWEAGIMLPMDEDGGMYCTVLAGQPQAVMLGADANLRCPVTADMLSVGGKGIPMLTGLEAGEPVQPDPERPSLILRRAGTDSLWTVAKESGSTVDAIRSANKLTQDPEPGQILLVPVV